MSYILSYLQFSDQRDLVRFRAQLCPQECEILRVVAKSHLMDRDLRASQLVEMEYLGSPSTIHAIIKRLLAKKMILVEVDPADHRIKYIVPSPRALNLLDELGRLMSSSEIPPPQFEVGSDQIVQIESLSMQNAG